MRAEFNIADSSDYFLPVTTQDWIYYHETLFNMHISQLNNGITFISNGIPKTYFHRERSAGEAMILLRCLIEDIMKLIKEKHCI
jgi:hypothetical protein